MCLIRFSYNLKDITLLKALKLIKLSVIYMINCTEGPNLGLVEES